MITSTLYIGDPIATLRSRADPGLVKGGEVEAPQASEAAPLWFGEGVSPSPTGRGLGRGLCHRNFSEFLSRNGAFLCILQSAAVILGSENAWRRASVGFLS